MFSRRTFLKTGLAFAGLSLSGCSISTRNSSVLISAARDPEGRHFIQAFTADGGKLGRWPIPARAHDIAARPSSSEVVVFDRRPGRLLYQLDWKKPQEVDSVVSHPLRHFYGHGVFSQDGRWLYTTENDLETLNGIIGVYDAEKGYQKVREFTLSGPGPHEIAMMPDGNTLVVALGGIQTHPDSGRETLNPESLKPALLYIDRNTGDELERQVFVDPALSIRHLGVAPDGTVAIGMQYQGDPETLPLVALHQRGEPLKPVKATEAQWLALNGYIASVCFIPDSQTLAVTTPRGNRIGLIDASSGELKTLIHNRDCAGAATTASGLLAVSNGLGDIQLLKCHQGQAEEVSIARIKGCQWDNHMLSLG
ncbi:DUF1513 domain-containing protein [Endozoicomonas arenosclerae]|uniref:DUF1513 domain-containing protein n=1 Tax=Endozoicomonas arenosclerae TaxID=1633495 RepID=UPI0007817239|nr:DUF1513 domain-containing protein [Endozoicomonas arenosclerae]